MKNGGSGPADSPGDQEEHESSVHSAPQALSESADSSRAGLGTARASAPPVGGNDHQKKSLVTSNGPVSDGEKYDQDGNKHSRDGRGVDHSAAAATTAAADDQPFAIPSWLRAMNKGRKLCGRFVNHDRVQLSVVILITVNAIMMGIGTFDFVTDDPAIEDTFEKVDLAFLIIFTAELGLQFLYHGARLFLDGWLLFDFIVIILSWAFAEAQIIRAFRIFRALRLVTRVSVMRNLVKALFAVMPKMSAIAMLLGLVMYIFTVMFTQLFKYSYEKDYTQYDYFSRLDRTFFTLFQIMTFDKWADPARSIMPVYPWAGVLFVVFVVVSGFIFVNLIVAVICDAIGTLHEDEKALLRGHGGIIDDDSDWSDLEEEERERRISQRQLTVEEDEGARRRSSLGEGLEHQSSLRRRGLYVERQIKALEKQVEVAKRMNENAARTIEYLTQQLQNRHPPDR